MPHDIIDNRELHLADAVRPLLSESVRAHFAVGYFFLSGFKAIADQLATVQELRLLIGNTSDRATIEQLAEGHGSREVCERMGLNWLAACQIHADDWLSFDPRSVTTLNEAQEAELQVV